MTIDDYTLLTADKVAKWYFGGLSSSIAVTITHPLDLIKVHLQTQGKAKMGIMQMGSNIIKRDGFFSLYNGISAAVARQVFYSMPRFGIYEYYKNQVTKSRKMPIYEQVSVAGVSGMIAGFISTPFDLINVRMQSDIKLPMNERRNYKHVFDGLHSIVRNENVATLYNGCSMTITRAAMINIGQGAGYDIVKAKMIASGMFNDNPKTHVLSATTAAMIAIALSNPLDVIKTRIMNAPPKHFDSIMHCTKDILDTNGPQGFYKGLSAAFIRIGPHTVLLYLIKEQMIKLFGTSSE